MLRGVKKARPKSQKPQLPRKKNTLAEKVKGCKKQEGLFTIYQDTANGTLYLAIKKQQIDQEFIYFGYTENGVVEAGHFKGNFRDNKIFSVRKYYDRIEFVTENTRFYFDTTSALNKAKDANVSNSVLLSQKIVGEDANKDEYLIEANPLFLSESMSPIKPTIPPMLAMVAFNPGGLNTAKSKYAHIHNYPANTDVVVDYVFDNPMPLNGGSDAVVDARSVTIRYQHSFIEMPDNDYQPRMDDQRVGFFSTETDNQTSADAAPYRDLIHRWNLKKKDSTAALSEPVEPITWWIENTTPVEFRETIRQAGLAWNIAFEKAGFKNAVRMEIQPDTATWDAGDIRYNVLRWTSSPQPPFGGYGPSFVNPRTGEIIGADIMLEYIFMTNRMQQEKLFSASALAEEMSLLPAKQRANCCFLSEQLHQTSMFGMAGLKTMNASAVEQSEYLKSSLYYLVLHEMGHTAWPHAQYESQPDMDA